MTNRLPGEESSPGASGTLCVPLDLNGPLPPGITANFVGRAVEDSVNVSTFVQSHRGKWTDSKRERMRAMLNQRSFRDGFRHHLRSGEPEDLPSGQPSSALPRLLVRHVKQQPCGREVFDRLVEPALVELKNAVTIDVTKLRACLDSDGPEFLALEDPIAPDGRFEALGVLLTSYTWLFPRIAAQAIRAVLERWHCMEGFWGIDASVCRAVIDRLDATGAEGAPELGSPPGLAVGAGQIASASFARHEESTAPSEVTWRLTDPVEPRSEPSDLPGSERSPENHAAAGLSVEILAAVARLREFAHQRVALGPRIASAVGSGKFGEVVRLGEQGEALAGQLCATTAEIAEMAGVPRSAFPAANDVRDEGDADRYVGEVENVLRESARIARGRVEARRHALEDRLQAAGVAFPPALAAVASLADLDAVERTIRDELAEAELESQLRRGEIPARSSRDAVSPERRIEIYARRARAVDVNGVLAWLQGDVPAVRASPERAFELLASAIEVALEKGDALPEGGWLLLQSIDPGQLVGRLVEGPLPGLIRRSDGHAARVGELASVVGKAKTHADVTIPVGLHVAHALPPDARAREFARLAQLAPLDPVVANALIAALADAGRHAEVWLVGDACARAGVAFSCSSAWRSSVLALLVERTMDDREPVGVIDQFLSWEEWAEDVDGFTVLAFILALRNCPRRDLLYRHPALVEDVARCRPDLWSLWLRPSMEGKIAPLVDPAARANWERGREAICAWDAEIQKRTCYQGWRCAEEYQRQFRVVLDGWMSEAAAGHVVVEQDADEVIRRVGVANRLPAVEHPALGLMRSYLTDQIARLDAVSAAMQQNRATLAELRRIVDPPFRVRVEEESRAPANRSAPMIAIYGRALEASRVH